MISLIVAYSKNRVIGKNSDMPWYLPADLKHFKQVTSGQTVIMGSKTFESIVARLGGPLPNRRNIVLSRNPDYKAVGAEVVISIEDALKAAGDEEAFIIGGGEVFKLALSQADKIYATEIDADIPGDVYFPEISQQDWHVAKSEQYKADEKNQHSYTFVQYERVKNDRA